MTRRSPLARLWFCCCCWPLPRGAGVEAEIAAALSIDSRGRKERRPRARPLAAVELAGEDVRLPVQAVGLRRGVRPARPAQVHRARHDQVCRAGSRGCSASTWPRRTARNARSTDARAEHWICDGKSVWEYSPAKKQVIEHKLPPELQGSRLVDGPLSFGFPVALLRGCVSSASGSPLPARPFPFGANAKELKQQYYIRTVTPADRRDQIWLEAFPRSAAACGLPLPKTGVDLRRASDMSPFALRIVQPNGKDYTVYQFYDIVVNDPASRSEARSIRLSPWLAEIPDDSPPSAAKRTGNPNSRRRTADTSRPPELTALARGPIMW